MNVYCLLNRFSEYLELPVEVKVFPISTAQADRKSFKFMYDTHRHCVRTRTQHCTEPLTNDHPHQRPSLSYDHISCDGQWFLFVYESLTSDHPSYTTTPMWFWGWSYKRGSPVQHVCCAQPNTDICHTFVARLYILRFFTAFLGHVLCVCHHICFCFCCQNAKGDEELQVDKLNRLELELQELSSHGNKDDKEVGVTWNDVSCFMVQYRLIASMRKYVNSSCDSCNWWIFSVYVDFNYSRSWYRTFIVWQETYNN